MFAWLNDLLCPMSLNFQDDFLENVDFAAAEPKNSAQSKASDVPQEKVKAIFFQNVLLQNLVLSKACDCKQNK